MLSLNSHDLLCWGNVALDKSEVHLKDYIAVIRRHDFVAIISFLLVFGTALIVSLYLPRVYESSAIIEMQQTSSPSGISGLMQNVISRGVDQVSMETVCKRFVSNSILNETISNIKRRSPEKNRDLSPEFLAPKVTAKTVPDTRMIEVKIRMRMDEGGSERASVIANELVWVMQKQRGERTNKEMAHRQDFLDEKISYVESQLSDSDKNIRKFLKDKGNSAIWSAYLDSLLGRISSLINMKEGNETLAKAEKKKLDELKAKLEDEPEFTESSRTLSRDVLWNKHKTDLAELELKLIEVRSIFGEESPRVKSLLDQIAEINGKMRLLANEKMSVSGKTESLNPNYQSIVSQIIESELRLISYNATRDMADKMLKELNSEKDQIFSEMPSNQYQLESMNKEAGYKLNIYEDLMSKKVEAEIMANESINEGSRIKGGIELVDPAQPSSRPVSPRIKFISVIAGIMGLAAGLSMAFLAEYFKKS